MKETFRELYKTVYIFWDGFWVIWLAEILFVVCSMPIITVPAAMAGMYFTMNELAHGESVDWSTFFTGMKKYYWAGYRWFGVNLLIGSVLVFYIFFFASSAGGIDPNVGQLISGIPLGLLVVWILINFLTFPLMLAQETPSYRQALRNSLVFYLKWPGFTIIFSLVMALVMGVSFWLIVPWFLFGVSLPALLSCVCIKIKTEKETSAGS